MLRIQEQEERAAESLRNEGTDGARVVEAGSAVKEALGKLPYPLIRVSESAKLAAANLARVAQKGYRETHGRIDNFSALAAAYATYQEIQSGADAKPQTDERPDEAYMSATFAGIREALAHKSGDMPTGCFRCEWPARWLYSGSLWIRHEGNRHYLVFTDASGHSTEYRIWFCPYCGKKF